MELKMSLDILQIGGVLGVAEAEVTDITSGKAGLHTWREEGKETPRRLSQNNSEQPQLCS